MRLRPAVPAVIGASHQRCSNAIAVLPLGRVRKDALAIADRAIPLIFGVPTMRLKPVALPRHAFDRNRIQYDAHLLLDFLLKRIPASVLRVVGITDEDIFMGGKSFVFGCAYHFSVAVCSTRELREEPPGGGEPDPAVFENTFSEILIHEIGHTCGAQHHHDPRCVMSETGIVCPLYEQTSAFCESCLGKIRSGFKIDPAGAETAFRAGGRLLRGREFRGAIDAYCTAIRLYYIRHPACFNNLGVACWHEGFNAKGVSPSFHHAAFLSSSPVPYLNLALLAAAEDHPDLDAAEIHLETALQRSRNRARIHGWASLLYREKLDRPDLADRHASALERLGGSIHPDDLRRVRSGRWVELAIPMGTIRSGRRRSFQRPLG